MKRSLKFCVIGLSAFGVGACTSSVGLDLTLRGILNLSITRQSGSVIATALGTVNDNGYFLRPPIQLESNQIFTVDGVALDSSLAILNGQVPAVAAPSSYSVSFDDNGTVNTQSITPPVDFTALTPANDAQVSRQGFDITWAPSGEANVQISAEIEGLGPSDDGGLESHDVVLALFPDNGTLHIPQADLAVFSNGTITITVVRARVLDQDLGLASGQLRAQIRATLLLTLIN